MTHTASRSFHLRCFHKRIGILMVLTGLVAMAGSCDVMAGRDMIPAQRRIEWSAGVPGGIPDVPIAANAKDFGARGDGVADDAPSIQRAIDSVSSGAVLIPAGSYMLRSPLTIRKTMCCVAKAPAELAS